MRLVMVQSRTHNCGQLRLPDVGEKVTLVGFYDNMRKVSKNLGFLILRDFYGITQVVVETEEMMDKLSGVNNESTLSITGTVRERSSKNGNLPTDETKSYRKISRYLASVFIMNFHLKLTEVRKRMKQPV